MSSIITTGIVPNQSLFFFVAYGRILDIVASKADPKKRGYAFIVFGDITAATYALHGLHGREFLGRIININYAKTKSNKVAMLEGTFKIRRKKQENQDVAQNVLSTKECPADPVVSDQPKTPGCTLFVENLPSIMNEVALSILFRQYPGFREARIVSGRGVGFVEYNNELQANLAMQGLNGFLVAPTNALKISISN